MTEKSWLHWSTSMKLCSFAHFSSVSMTEKSWLHWSLSCCNHCNIFEMMFPWLKSHGSIEATILEMTFRLLPLCFHDWKVMAPLKLGYCVTCGTPDRDVSMTEKSWLHWSQKEAVVHGLNHNRFHDWKVMAPLKRLYVPANLIVNRQFPWLKSHGSIEASDTALHPVRMFLRFHDWKVMAPLKHSHNLCFAS